jgi:NAD(P)-dependent dehydrogenase (short-subunit alcohol dehydrogenase family)
MQLLRNGRGTGPAEPHMLDATSSTHDVVAGIDLSGRRVLVTGGAGGLGFATAEALATAGAVVAIADHNADRAREAVRRINANVGTVRAQAYTVDLASIASVRAFAESVSDAQFDTLVNNAGIVRPDLGRTAEGFELTLATNYLGHFLLTGLLMPRLLEHATPRVVNLSSGAHRDSPVVFDDPFYERRPYDAREAYAQSKSATALFTLALDRRFGDAGLLALTVRPAKSDTGIFAALTDEQRGAFSTRVKARQAGAPIEIAAATSVWACVAPAPPLRRAAYLSGCDVVATPDRPGVGSSAAPWIFDTDAADRLWTMSETAVAETFDPIAISG